MFDPESVIKLYKPNFNLMEFIKGNKDMIVNKAQEASVLNDLKVYIFLGALFILAILIALALSIIRKYRQKIITKMKQIYDKTIWNGIIRSIDIGYIETVMTTGT